MFVVIYRKLLITLFFLFMNSSIFCFHDNQIILDSTPFYSFLNEVEENETLKEQVLLIRELLTETVSAINKRKLYYNPKIKTDLLDILQRLDKFENVKPRDIRRFKKAVFDFDSYLIQYIDNLGFFLNRKEKEFLGGIRLFNYQAKKLLQDQAFLQFSALQKTGDFVFFRPLEFVAVNKNLFGSFLLISGALSSYFFLHSGVKKPSKKRDIPESQTRQKKETLILENYNESYNVLQISVNTQKEAVCALHAVWNCFLGSASATVEQFRENEQKYLDDFYVWIKKIRAHFEENNWFDDGVIEKIITNKEFVPDFVEEAELTKIRIFRALPNGSDNFLKMHRNRLDGQDLDEEVYSSALAAELDGSLKSFADGEIQNLVLLINDHFISLKLKKSDECPGVFEPWITNSLGNMNYTNNDAVNRVLDYYVDSLN